MQPEGAQRLIRERFELEGQNIPREQAPFSQWQLPGGENYRIVAVKAAPQPSPHYGYPESAGFAPPHQGIPDNTIVHMRMNDRVTPDGKKALFVEEVQSDWANTGRKEGFKQELTPEVKAEIETLEAQRRRAGLSSGIEAGARYTELTRQIDQLRGVDAVPNHPLLSRYPEVAMKRALYEAADGGYDSLAWTTGKQQADRYDLSKHVDSIEWVFDKTDGLYDLNITTKTGEFLPRQVAPDDLPNEIGKDIAGKMAASVEAGENFGKLKGLDLKIGGEWATNLYDKQLVNIVNKLAKKWGGKVGSKTIITDAPSGRFRLLFSTDAGAREQWFNARADAEEWMRNVEHTNPGWMSDAHIKEVHGKETTVHSLDITPEMRAAIKKQGFPLFEGAGAAIGGETLRQAYEEGRRQQNMPELPRVGY
jgi:uncharacterized protein YfiM (DUF2279 family)